MLVNVSMVQYKLDSQVDDLETILTRKKIILDVLQNTVASALPLLFLQLFILPKLALALDAETYGRSISIYSLLILIAGSFGSVLNNIRLIHQDKYNSEKLEGDFNYLALLSLACVFTSVSLSYFIVIRGSDFLEYIAIALASLLYMSYIYMEVGFRLSLHFGRILVGKLMLTCGFGVGYILFRLLNQWSMIYLSAYIVAFMYVAQYSNIKNDSIRKTKLYKSTRRDFLMLLFSGLLVSSGVYVDKLILFPYLGGAAVAVYYTATVLPKTLSLAIEPSTGVLLSYLSRVRKIERKHFFYFITIVLFICFISYFLLIKLSIPILNFFYPAYANATKVFIPITAATSIVGIFSNILNALVLRYGKALWQLKLNIAYIASYIALVYVFMLPSGIIGLCIAVLIANIFRCMVLLILVLQLRSKRIF